MDFINAKIASNPELAGQLSALAELHHKKLYFQLSEKLIDLLREPSAHQGTFLLELYEKFVAKFSQQLKPLSLVRFVVVVSKKKPDPAAQIEFLETIRKTIADDVEAELVSRLEILLVRIHNGKAEECKAELEDCKQFLENYQGILDGVVHSTYYRAALQFHKVVGTAAQFYDNSLLYLAYTPLENIPRAEQLDLASAVGLAALIGDKVYNFGELLQHPIIKVLDETEFSWLGQLLFSFNNGDIQRYQAIAEEKGANQDLLKRNATFLNQKIRIMALMDLVFKKPSENRTLSFEEISRVCMLPTDEVELLLMKAFSIKVLKGTIDQVSQTVQIKWVQPRVLSKDQIVNMKERFDLWTKETQKTNLFLEDTAPELFS